MARAYRQARQYSTTAVTPSGLLRAYRTGTAVSLLVPSDALWRGATYYVQSPLFLATLRTATSGLPMASTVPPATPLVIWAVLYVLAGVAGAMLIFSRRDLRGELVTNDNP